MQHSWAYLLYGGELPNGTTPLTVAADTRLVGERPLSTTGLALAGGGDLDDDGVDDFVVSAPASVDDTVPGTAYLFYGGPESISGTTRVGGRPMPRSWAKGSVTLPVWILRSPMISTANRI